MIGQSTLRLQVMGPLRLWRGGVELDAGPRQQRCLLALLLAQDGQPISLPRLVDLLWDIEPPDSAVNTIHKYVGALRRLLEPRLPSRARGSYLLPHGNGYRLVPDPGSVDLAVFRRAVTAATLCLDRGADDAALTHYLGALAHYRGPVGEDLGAGRMAASAFARIDGEFVDAAVAAAEVALRVGRAAKVLAPLRMAVAIDPLNEPAHAGLVTALAATGRLAEALQTHYSVSRRLVSELGINPGPMLQTAHRHVLLQGVTA